MNVTEIINKVEEVNTKSNYWFVRTEHGRLFEDFCEGNYIAIGWDYLLLNHIKEYPENKIKEIIASKEGFDLTTFRGKGQTTSVYNKIINFINIKKGDIIIIPSRSSSRLAFGKVMDEKPYEEINAKSYLKRRKIHWYKIENMNNLNPIFYQVKSNQHTISNIGRYSQYIDRVIGNLYKKGENTHYVLNIEKEENINFEELRELMDNINSLLKNINREFDFDEDTNNFFVKVNLQSKGAFELIKSGKSLAILAFLVFATSCNNDVDVRDNRIKKFMEDNEILLQRTSKNIDSLKINTKELTKPFENGH